MSFVLLPEAQRDRLEIVLVSPRNPLNIGAAARAMANFGFSRLAVVAPYAPHWREARSAVGAPQLLEAAVEIATLAEAVARCTLVVGTGTLTYRKPEQKVVALPNLAPLVERELACGGRIAFVFGPEKHGLTREDLSLCHLLVEIPTDPRQPSMNLGQAVAVCLYELASRAFPPEKSATAGDRGTKPCRVLRRPGTACPRGRRSNDCRGLLPALDAGSKPARPSAPASPPGPKSARHAAHSRFVPANPMALEANSKRELIVHLCHAQVGDIFQTRYGILLKWRS
jgi:TrmH family RNA methyltransferase